jgi:hypothetical protein
LLSCSRQPGSSISGCLPANFDILGSKSTGTGNFSVAGSPWGSILTRGEKEVRILGKSTVILRGGLVDIIRVEDWDNRFVRDAGGFESLIIGVIKIEELDIRF